ncbi:MAG: hypothetical protein M3O02_06245, partial [Acidobacteriota bacterium]|nr:hypothetical protein [Acidobacteriota bacterium]
RRTFGLAAAGILLGFAAAAAAGYMYLQSTGAIRPHTTIPAPEHAPGQTPADPPPASPAPSTPSTDPEPRGAQTPTVVTPRRTRPAGTSPHLLPREVQMEAQAARASAADQSQGTQSQGTQSLPPAETGRRPLAGQPGTTPNEPQ